MMEFTYQDWQLSSRHGSVRDGLLDHAHYAAIQQAVEAVPVDDRLATRVLGLLTGRLRQTRGSSSRDMRPECLKVRVSLRLSVAG